VQSTSRAENTTQTGTVKNFTSSAKYKRGGGRFKDMLGKKPAEFLRLFFPKFLAAEYIFLLDFFYTFCKARKPKHFM